MSAFKISCGLSLLVRRLVTLTTRVITLTIMWTAFLVSRFETGRMIILDKRGFNAPGLLASRVVVFSHFDNQGLIRHHTRAYIDALRAEGLDVVFVSNAARLAPLDLAWIQSRASRILIRRNSGYDFAAWRDALSVCGLPAANTSLLLLANDSVYGPLHQLGPVLNRIDFAEADVWGATDSWQHRFHLQSFFIAFGPKAFSDEAFNTFWRSVQNIRSKAWVVKHYELGLSRSLIAAGLRCKAIWSYIEMIEVLRQNVAEQDAQEREIEARLRSRIEPDQGNRQPNELFANAARLNAERILRIANRRVPLNPTADLWRVLIEQGFPFLKRELLRSNPSRVPDIAIWSTVVNEIRGFDRDIILRDLEKSLKNLTP